MAKDFLLEIGTEEIPAKFMPGALAQLEDQASKRLADLRLGFDGIKAYATPRRLVLQIFGLAEKQVDLNAEVKGPAVKAAYDAEGNATKAAQGFAKGQGVEVADLFTQEVNGVPYVFARKLEAGRDTKELLPDFCLNLIGSLNFPKPMRWGSLDVRFARPIRWLVALYGEDVLPFAYVGLEAGRESRGHRTLAPGLVVIKEASGYKEALRAAYVMVDPAERREVIWKEIQALAGEAGGKVEDDEELLTEVIHLVEYPTALLGKVAPSYMHLPEAVITTPMKEHQRYFPVRSADGKLLPYFITVRNGDATALDVVAKGNEKVLKARLEDAAFYYREDQKQPLADLVLKLEKIVYHEKLGTVRQRVERLRRLATHVAGELGLGSAKQETIDRTALLAKVDLVTLMVYDFPELQGIMGADYANASGEAPEVCQGILEHYQPRFAGDVLPASEAGKIVSVADKLDAIVGAFGIGIQPTGSQDPYALRRQAQGVVGIIVDAGWDVPLTKLLSEAYQGFTTQGVQLLPLEEILPVLQDFFQQRLRYVLQEQGLRYDAIEAVLAQGSDFLFRAASKAKALAALREQEEFVPYAQAYTRCFNLTRKEKPQALDVAKLVDPSEIELAEGISLRRERFDALIDRGDFAQAYSVVAELVPMIEKLFLAVMIMVDDEYLRKARLALLGQCVEMLGCVGDLSLLA